MNYETITKQEWVTVVQWISLRWDHLKWDDEQIKSLYEDYKMFPSDVVWTALNRYYDNGHKFFNSVEFRKACSDEYQNFARELDGKMRLTTGEVMELNKGGLIEFLESAGYESFAHAVYVIGHERYKAGKQTPTDGDMYKRPWEEAKDDWLMSFTPIWNLEFLKQKREREVKEKING